MKKSTAFRITILTLWILGILAPLYRLSRGLPSSRLTFDRVFQTQASHILTHTFLYAVLAYLLASVFYRSTWSAKQLMISVLMIVVMVAVLQEAVQMISEEMGLGLDEIFDIFVDLGGALIGAGLYFGFHRHQRRSISSIDGA